MAPRKKPEKPARVQTRQLMELVRFLARTLGFTNAALARKADVPLASLMRYFKGEGEPKIEFLLAVVQAMGLEVREFFDLAYPDPAGVSAARAKVDRILRQVQPGRLLEPSPPPPKPEPLMDRALPTREEIEKMLDQLRKDVQIIMERAGRDQPAAPGQPRRLKENGEV